MSSQPNLAAASKPPALPSLPFIGGQAQKSPQPVSLNSKCKFIIEQRSNIPKSIVLRQVLHLASPPSLSLHLAIQALCFAIPEGPMGNGLPHFLDTFRSASIRQNHDRHARKQSRVPVKHHLHDFHQRILPLLQFLLHILANLYVRLTVEIYDEGYV